MVPWPALVLASLLGFLLGLAFRWPWAAWVALGIAAAVGGLWLRQQFYFSM